MDTFGQKHFFFAARKTPKVMKNNHELGKIQTPFLTPRRKARKGNPKDV
jgi:hypothetical protein